MQSTEGNVEKHFCEDCGPKHGKNVQRMNKYAEIMKTACRNKK